MFQTAESRYNQWVHEHHRFLLRSAWALTGSRAVAEDVVQDCFTSAWKHRTQLRHTPLLARRSVRRCIVALLLAGGGSGAVFTLRPPALVRDAIKHEYDERTLRGSFMPAQALLAPLGLSPSQAVPASPQLLRPCEIEGHLAYHLSTFFEKGGMVTVFAFDAPVALKAGNGWWNNVYWQVIRAREGKPMVLVAQKEKAVAVAQTSFTPASG